MPKQTVDVIVAQAKHESSNFASPVYRRNNNPFGMRVAKIRPHTHIGDPDKDFYANYVDIEAATEDLIQWWKYAGYNLQQFAFTPELYVSIAKRKNYFEADIDAYLKGVKLWMA